MQDAYIIDAVRTPFGKFDGLFRDTHPQDLASEPLKALEERNNASGSDDVEDVIYGCVVPVDEQGLNIARIEP
jgi:acetyl-CoA acetyltransferase